MGQALKLAGLGFFPQEALFIKTPRGRRSQKCAARRVCMTWARKKLHSPQYGCS